MSTNLISRKSKKQKTLLGQLTSLNALIMAKKVVQDDEFILAVAKARQDLQDAENFFDNVTDLELIDHAIYKIQAARSKYIYLIRQAKEKGIVAGYN